MGDSNTHRELVAAVANLKFSIKSVVISCKSSDALSGPSPTTVQRALGSVGALHRLLVGLNEQVIRLPLETSRRIVEVDLPQQLVLLLQAVDPTAVWCVDPPCASLEGSTAPGNDTGHAGKAAPPPQQQPPQGAWVAVQQLLTAALSCVQLLGAAAVRASTRSRDPVSVLQQLVASGLVAASAHHLTSLRDADAPAAAAAFAACFAPLTATVGGHALLNDVHTQLLQALHSARFLPAACQLLLQSAAAPAGPAPPSAGTAGPVAASDGSDQALQRAAADLLTLALSLADMHDAGAGANPPPPYSGASPPAGASPRSPVDACCWPSSPTLSGMSADTCDAPPQRGCDVDGTSGVQAHPCCHPLTEPPVQWLLQERLTQGARALRGTAPKHAIVDVERANAGFSLHAPPPPVICLPGQVPQMDAAHIVLDALQCWRSLLRARRTGPASFCSGTAATAAAPLDGVRGVQLLVDVLGGVLHEAPRGRERGAGRAGCVLAAAECLQLMCCAGGAPAAPLEDKPGTAELAAVARAACGVVTSAAGCWDSHRRSVKSADLALSWQLKCIESQAADLMWGYCEAAGMMLSSLRALLHCAVGAGGACNAAGADVDPLAVAAAAVASSRLLPCLEQLFRSLPPAGPAHIEAAELLVDIVPAMVRTAPGAAPAPEGLPPLLTTLRKFLVRSSGIADPDRDPAMRVAASLCQLLADMADVSAGAAGSGSAGLAALAACQLLPGLHAFCTSLPKAAGGGAAGAAQRRHLFTAYLLMLSRLAAASRAAEATCSSSDALWLLPLVAAHHGFPLAASMLDSGFVAPQHASGRLGASRAAHAAASSALAAAVVGLVEDAASACSGALAQGVYTSAPAESICGGPATAVRKNQALVLLSSLVHSKALAGAQQLLQQLLQAELSACADAWQGADAVCTIGALMPGPAAPEAQLLHTTSTCGSGVARPLPMQTKQLGSIAILAAADAGGGVPRAPPRQGALPGLCRSASAASAPTPVLGSSYGSCGSFGSGLLGATLSTPSAPWPGSCASLASLALGGCDEDAAEWGAAAPGAAALQARFDAAVLAVAAAATAVLPEGYGGASGGAAAATPGPWVASHPAVILRASLAAAHAAAATAPPGADGGCVDDGAARMALPPASLRRLLKDLAAVAPHLAAAAVRAEAGASADALAAGLTLQPPGCWNPRCTNLVGASEAALPGAAACDGCGAARYCCNSCRRGAAGAHQRACAAAGAARRAAGGHQ